MKLFIFSVYLFMKQFFFSVYVAEVIIKKADRFIIKFIILKNTTWTLVNDLQTKISLKLSYVLQNISKVSDESYHY